MAILQTDICIIGAGPGGATAAIQLAKLGYGCLLVDKAVFPRDKICGDALSGKVVETLRKLDGGVLQRLHGDVPQVGSWGVNFVAPNGKVLRVPFKRQIDTQAMPPGYISKRMDFDHFLLQEALKYPQVQWLGNTAIEQFERVGEGYRLSSKDGNTVINARLVLAADGAQSQFARQIGGINMERAHYCAGIRAYYTGVQGRDAQNFIELHFIKDLLPGYFWIFPLPNGAANVGLGMRSDFVAKKKLNLSAMLPQLIASHPILKERFQQATLEGPIKGFGLPLGSKKRRISGDHYLLLGDAASLIDPFTGEGIGNAMVSGVLAAQQAAQCLDANRFDAAHMLHYDKAVYNKLWSELSLSRRMQQLVQVPWLFNLVVNKALRNKTLQETISCMFEDLDMRARLKKPSFYVNLLID
ncbi:MAG: geranylgeranyl reductase family protein [Chitinophagales bacterium]|nr:geranylgeranyl reductase family protein [Chitinophagales bacterium]